MRILTCYALCRPIVSFFSRFTDMLGIPVRVMAINLLRDVLTVVFIR